MPTHEKSLTTLRNIRLIGNLLLRATFFILFRAFNSLSSRWLYLDILLLTSLVYFSVLLSVALACSCHFMNRFSCFIAETCFELLLGFVQILLFKLATPNYKLFFLAASIGILLANATLQLFIRR